jgi:hypothetical protein
MLHYLGLVIILCTWAAGLFLLRTTHDKSLQTISKHAATSLKTSLYFGAAMFVIGVLFYWWLHQWLGPHLRLTSAFTVLLDLTILCQVAIGLFPDRPGWMQHVHRLAAYGMAVLFMPLAAVIVVSSELLTLVQVVCTVFLLYMLISFTLIAVLRKNRNRYLLFQVSYIVAFDLIILFAGYLPTKL